MIKTSKEYYELHCIQIENIKADSSVIGSVSTTGRRVKGSTSTIHISSITANNKLYQLRQKNQIYPFQKGDNVILICHKHKKSGIYVIFSLFNLTNNTKFIQGKVSAFFTPFIVLPIFLIFLATLGSLGATYLAGAMFFVWLYLLIWLPYVIYRDFKYHKLALKAAFAIENIKDKTIIDKQLENYLGKSVVNDNFLVS